MLNIHRQDTHGLGWGGEQRREQPGDAARSKVEKVPRSSLQKGLSEKRRWVRYKRSTVLVDVVMIRDQLLACCSDELSEDLGNLYGEQLDTKDEVTFLEEMHMLAVVALNHLVNIVRSLIQERDESVRSYLARLKGAAMVWMVDEDIRKLVWSVVEEMDLDSTVKFIEAKESGKKAGVYLNSGEVDVNKVLCTGRLRRSSSWLILGQAARNHVLGGGFLLK